MPPARNQHQPRCLHHPRAPPVHHDDLVRLMVCRRRRCCRFRRQQPESVQERNESGKNNQPYLAVQKAPLRVGMTNNPLRAAVAASLAKVASVPSLTIIQRDCSRTVGLPRQSLTVADPRVDQLAFPARLRVQSRPMIAQFVSQCRCCGSHVLCCSLC